CSSDLSKGKPDPAWSTASEKTLRNEMAQLPSNFSSRLEFSRVTCGPSLSEIQAAARFTSPYQSSEDILDWQAFVQEMLRSPSSQADQLTNPVTILSMTPDDRPLFVVYFHRGQKGGSNSAGNCTRRNVYSRTGAISPLQRSCRSRCVTAMTFANSRSRSVGATARPARAPSRSAVLRFWLSL